MQSHYHRAQGGAVKVCYISTGPSHMSQPRLTSWRQIGVWMLFLFALPLVEFFVMLRASGNNLQSFNSQCETHNRKNLEALIDSELWSSILAISRQHAGSVFLVKALNQDWPIRQHKNLQTKQYKMRQADKTKHRYYWGHCRVYCETINKELIE